MSKFTLRGKDLLPLGFKQGRAIGIAINVMQKHYPKIEREQKLALLADIIAQPETYLEHEILGGIARELLPPVQLSPARIDLLPAHLPYSIFGAEHIEEGAIDQMKMAMSLPVTLGGALMPDAHQGYGLPIGGVLATRNAVIPFGVGVDIGCRMCLTFYDIAPSYLGGHLDRFKQYLNEHTRFGLGGEFEQPMDDEILSHAAFSEIDIAKKLHYKAARQIGSSGGGNHFVEFGVVEIADEPNELNLPKGNYIGILSHSGSRGLGATIANHYTNLAVAQCPLPKGAQHLAWLDLDSELGQEYWIAMNLAGDYASACHHHIHRRLARALGCKPLATVENHHNFAWKETLADGTEAIVHRKGATPAAKGVLGIIPGSMASAGYIVRGRGHLSSLNSASHGAGRLLSRRKALDSITQHALKELLDQQGVTLIGGGLDEAPMAYKDIGTVMAAQQDLVDIVGIFRPKIVRMAQE
jgi:tRNA-splicing ligase RtcB